ncbi:hypothetical protein BDB00DRAFT_792493 [Zychaea mexicana]|uniref:uncharacterized protein n=1 Tax=Zychaea mexicana TaxID=64656 RepID=UPI0022FDDB43|nr:uncharacterized protein BDB00DRAFT_792493 [Zychaea mexicana]KAI9484927.1 hypothetical protein BDB00DRAFT_792493 [Zychaea mexicana]
MDVQQTNVPSKFVRETTTYQAFIHLVTNGSPEEKQYWGSFVTGDRLAAMGAADPVLKSAYDTIKKDETLMTDLKKKAFEMNVFIDGRTQHLKAYRRLLRKVLGEMNTKFGIEYSLLLNSPEEDYMEMAPMSSPAGHRAMDQRWPSLFNKRLTRKRVVRGMTKMEVQWSKFRKVEGFENHYRHTQWQVEIKGWDFGSDPLKKPNAMQCDKHELLEALKAGTISFIGPARPSGATTLPRSPVPMINSSPPPTSPAVAAPPFRASEFRVFALVRCNNHIFRCNNHTFHNVPEFPPQQLSNTRFKSKRIPPLRFRPCSDDNDFKTKIIKNTILTPVKQNKFSALFEAGY